METIFRFGFLWAVVLVLSLAGSREAFCSPPIPVPETVTLVDAGSRTCVPCKMMIPVLEKVKRKYKGRVAVIILDVWDPANADKARELKVMVIPTQIFYDRSGREVFRHIGFFDEKAITGQLEKILSGP